MFSCFGIFINFVIVFVNYGFVVKEVNGGIFDFVFFFGVFFEVFEVVGFVLIGGEDVKGDLIVDGEFVFFLL